MERSIYRYIWRYSKRQQIIVLLFTLVTFPLLYFSLEVPKIIINEALGSERLPANGEPPEPFDMPLAKGA